MVRFPFTRALIHPEPKVKCNHVSIPADPRNTVDDPEDSRLIHDVPYREACWQHYVFGGFN